MLNIASYQRNTNQNHCISAQKCVFVAQSCLTFHVPMDCSPPGSPVHGIFYTRVLEFPSLGDLPNSEIKPGSLALQADSLQSEPPGSAFAKTRLIKATDNRHW